jgi:hypothetical protein
MGAKKFDPVTIEQWVDLPDQERAEIVEGEILHKAAPSADHSFTASKLPVY